MTRGTLSRIWGSEAPESQERIARNCARILKQLAANSNKRLEFSVDVVRAWHREMSVGIKTDPAHPLGEFRGSNASRELEQCNVAVGNVPGVLAERVATELRRFQVKIVRRIAALDAKSPGEFADALVVQEIAALAAFAHGEWVRIHPFADGNGRTARMLGNWILLRYGLPPVVRLRPRPGSREYAIAARQSMARGDHRVMQRYVLDQLTTFVDGG